MDFTGKKFLSKIIAIIVICAMTLSDFILVGTSAISYAIDIANTTVDNVKFSAYFVNNNEEKVSNIEQATDAENLKMFVEVSVKNEGYFDGQISLGNSNFKIVNKILSDCITKIEENTVSLKRIDVGKTAKIELEIEKNLPDTMPASLLNMNTDVNLTGKYTDSKRTQDISGKANLKVDWKTSENTIAETTLEVLTNKVFEIDNQSKRVVQLHITSKLTNNNYPVKSTKIDITGSQGAEGAIVEARDTSATNGNAHFDEQNYTYNREEAKLEVNISNDSSDGDDAIIKYVKNSLDELIVTYIYPEETEIEGTEFIVNTKITTYDNQEKIAQKTVTANEQKDGIISLNVESTEKEIYKGKIYTGEDRAYESTTKINVNKAEIAENIEVNELVTAYGGPTHKEANIFFTQTKIVKSEFDKIFGQEGWIKITDTTGETVAEITTINSNSQADDNGNIIITYPANTKALKIETSKPIKVGTLNLVNTKTIKENVYDRETIKTFMDITEIVKGKYNDQDENTMQNHITLKDTSSKVAFSILNKELSTTEQNTVKLGIRLDTSNEQRDLYKNPTIRITLPKQVNAYDVTAKLVHGNGLSLNENSIGKDNDGESKVITVNLVGEQTQYVTDATGATLVLEAKMDLDPLAISSTEEIKLNYTNENATTYIDNGEKRISVNVIAKNPLITSTKIAKLNVQTTVEETKDVELERGAEAGKYTQVMDIVNNEGKILNNVKILGRYPVNNSKNNIGITITKQIQDLSQKSNVKIYFSTEENASNDLTNTNNKWTEQPSEQTKSYMIVLDTLKVGERFTFAYEMNVPADLSYNLSAETGYEVSYTKTDINTQNTLRATSIRFNTGKSAILTQTVKASVGGEEIKDGDTVKSGEIIKYTITVKNSGNEDATGLTFVGSVPEGTSYVEYNNNTEIPEVPDLAPTPDTLIEDKDKKEVKFENQTVKAKGELKLEYLVKTEVNDTKNITATLKLSNSNDKLQEDTFTTKVEPSDLKVSLSKFDSIYSNGVIKSGYEYRYVLSVKNNTNKDKENVQILLELNDLFKMKKIRYDNDGTQTTNTESSITIEKIKANQEAIFEVVVEAKNATDSLKVATLSVRVKEAKNEYRSNQIEEKVDTIELDVRTSARTTSNVTGYVKKGDKITYTFNIKNIGKTDAKYLEIKDEFSDYLVLENVTLNNKEAIYNKETVSNNGVKKTIITISIPLDVGETADVIITAKVNDAIDFNDLTKIANKATLYNTIKIADTEEISYLIEKTSSTPGSNGDNNGGNSSGENGGNNGGANNAYTIAGSAWKDENENGKREQNEPLLSDVNVKVLNIESKKFATDNSGKEITAKTNSEGLYALANVPTGKYIVVFEYDTAKYMPTKYKADGVSNDKNSDAILDNITINDETKQMTVSDTINLTNSVANIDIGLVDAKVFDMQLDKYISKIVVTNSDGTSVQEYKDATLAKADIAAKKLKDTQVVIEYTLRVKNAGEIAGYVRKVVDYKPTSLEFSSTLNKDWYLQGEDLYSSSLANTKIEPGETKELKLILTKTMTESNTGLIGNTAEIAEAYNTSGVNDIDSTPLNKMQKEDDIGQADVIIGIKTGAAISYIIITLTIIMTLGIGAYLVSKKVLNKEIKF